MQIAHRQRRDEGRVGRAGADRLGHGRRQRPDQVGLPADVLAGRQPHEVPVGPHFQARGGLLAFVADLDIPGVGRAGVGKDLQRAQRRPHVVKVQFNVRRVGRPLRVPLAVRQAREPGVGVERRHAIEVLVEVLGVVPGRLADAFGARRGGQGVEDAGHPGRCLLHGRLGRRRTPAGRQRQDRDHAYPRPHGHPPYRGLRPATIPVPVNNLHRRRGDVERSAASGANGVCGVRRCMPARRSQAYAGVMLSAAKRAVHALHRVIGRKGAAMWVFGRAVAGRRGSRGGGGDRLSGGRRGRQDGHALQRQGPHRVETPQPRQEPMEGGHGVARPQELRRHGPRPQGRANSSTSRAAATS